MAFDPTKPATSTLASSAEMRGQLSALSRTPSFNWMADPTMIIWAMGDSAAPSHYTLSGGAPTIARVGLGHGSDTKRKVGDFSAKVTASGGTAKLMQSLIPSAVMYRANMGSAYVGFGAWAWASVAGSVRLEVEDGLAGLASPYHSGSSSWEWLSLSGQIGAAATALNAGGSVASGTSGWFSGFTFIPGDVAPSGFILPRTVTGDLNFTFNGSLVVVSNKGRKIFQRPAIVKEVMIGVETAPTGAAIIVDVLKDNGGGWLSMTAAPVNLAVGQLIAGVQVNFSSFAEYHRCCMRSVHSGGSQTNARLRFDVTQVGSTVPGSDLSVHLTVLQFPLAWESELPGQGIL